MRGALWTVLMAVDFFLLSNPLVFIPSFDEALRDTLFITAVAALVSLLWIRVPSVPWVLLAFLGFAALSSAWSLSAGWTWRTLGLYAAVAVVAMLIAANATVPVLVDGLTLGGVLIVAGSFYALRAQLPGAAIPPGNEGFMAGVGTNRNILAYTLVLALAAAVSVAPKSPLGWVARTGCVAVIVLTVYLADSATGYLAAAAVVASALGIAVLEATRSVWIRRLVWGVPLALVVVVAVAARTIASSLGRDASTLSGRVPLWHAILDVMQDGPLLNGYGWGAVWWHPWSAAPPNGVLPRIQQQGGLPAAHGHNSFLDVLPELGLIGVALCALMYVRWGFEGVRLRRRAPRDLVTSRFLLVGLVGHLTFGLTEPLLTIPVGWFVLVLMLSTKSDAVDYAHPRGPAAVSPAPPGGRPASPLRTDAG